MHVLFKSVYVSTTFERWRSKSRAWCKIVTTLIYRTSYCIVLHQALNMILACLSVRLNICSLRISQILCHVYNQKLKCLSFGSCHVYPLAWNQGILMPLNSMSGSHLVVKSPVFVRLKLMWVSEAYRHF